ncbi:hypothetical protein D3C76_689240 [compost metagenome]
MAKAIIIKNPTSQYLAIRTNPEAPGRLAEVIGFGDGVLLPLVRPIRGFHPLGDLVTVRPEGGSLAVQGDAICLGGFAQLAPGVVIEA